MRMEIFSDSLFEVSIVGGGTCGLAVAARLCEATPGSIFTEDEHQRFLWLKQRGHNLGHVSRNGQRSTKSHQGKLNAADIVVLDLVSDSFLQQWHRQFASCQIPHLRSPMFFHPDPVDVDGMVIFADRERRFSDLKEIPNVVGKEYSKHQQRNILKRQCKRCPVPAAGANHDRPGIVDINMRDWKDYYRPSTRFFQDFCNDLVRRYGLENCVRKEEIVDVKYGDIHVLDRDEWVQGFILRAESGRVYAAKTCVVAAGHRGLTNFPIAGLALEQAATLDHMCHTTHIFAGDVTFPPAKGFASSRQLVIVGGGLTLAQLAHVACSAGQKVVLLLRGPLKIKHFDFHLDWVTKYKNVKKASFYNLDTDQERFELINFAREGGSINPEYHRLMSKHVQAGNLTIMRHSEILSGELVENTWSLTVQTNDPKVNQCVVSNLRARYVVCATGARADIESLDFLQAIQKDYPIDVVNGLPCLTDDLQWRSDIPLYMIGKYASLRIGPTSANLDGARSGAERVGWKIQEDYREKSKDSSVADIQLELASGQRNWFMLLQES